MEDISGLKIPLHVAVIMDGNGRWAKRRGMPRTYGHSKGADRVMELCEDADALGIRYLTVYAFSTENWKRPENEVSALMILFRKYLRICHQKAIVNHIRVRVIGEKSALDSDLQQSVRAMEEDTRENTGLQFQIAINYGSRDEILRAVRRLMEDCREGKADPAKLDEERFSSCLDTAGIPDPDLLIRTGGEQRLSNFLMWQHAYSEFYFTDTLWPDFGKADLVEAIRDYTGRDRRYGRVKE